MFDVTDKVVRGDEGRHESFDWGEIQWLDSGELTGAEGLTVGRVTVREGESNAEHYHPNCEEALYLLAGELEHTLGPDSVRLEPGDLLHVPLGERHRATSVGAGDAVAVVAYDTGDREVRFTGD